MVWFRGTPSSWANGQGIGFVGRRMKGGGGSGGVGGGWREGSNYMYNYQCLSDTQTRHSDPDLYTASYTVHTIHDVTTQNEAAGDPEQLQTIWEAYIRTTQAETPCF